MKKFDKFEYDDYTEVKCTCGIQPSIRCIVCGGHGYTISYNNHLYTVDEFKTKLYI